MLLLKQGSASSTANQVIVCSDPKKGQAMSTAFANMYRVISSLLGRSVDIDELKDFLWCLCHPQAPHQRCVDPRVYGGATSHQRCSEESMSRVYQSHETVYLGGSCQDFWLLTVQGASQKLHG